MARPWQDPAGDELVVDWCGPHALLRCRHEPEQRLLPATLPRAAGQVAVLASAVAREHPALEATAFALLRSLARPGSGVHTVWLALPGLEADDDGPAPLVQRVLTDLRVDVIAPDGRLAGTPDTGIYVGPSTGSAGWRRFHEGWPSAVVASRFPVPVWERTLPLYGFGAAGVVAAPVLAGLLVRPATAEPLTPEHPAFRIPADQARPKLLIENADIRPDQVAALLDQIPSAVRAALLLVPLTAATAGLGWISRLAQRWSHEVLLSTGLPVATATGGWATAVPGSDGEQGFRPFPTLLRQRPGVLDQDVLDIALPPAGWHRYAACGYRMTDDGPVADVVPAGLVLRDAATPAPRTRGSAPFDPHLWTLTVGVAGAPVDDHLLTALELLLAGLGDDQLRAVRVRVDGTLTESGRERITRIAGHAGVRAVLAPESPVPSAPTAQPANTVKPAKAFRPSKPFKAASTVSRGPKTVSVEPVDRPAEPESPPKPESSMVLGSSTVTESLPAPKFLSEAVSLSVPVLGSSSVTESLSAPEAPVVPMVSAIPVPTVSGPERAQTPDTESEPAAVEPDLAARTAEAAAPAEPEDAVLVSTTPWADRPSTGGEQTRFSAAAGSAFTDGLSIVNSALATWPALRRGESGAKTDYVAVCVYLSRGTTGAPAINRALRRGAEVPVDGYLACLVAGLARLPLHRRAVLRQGRLDGRWAVGSVLTDPGFVSASVGHDVTVEGAEADLLIWPRSAHRTSELMANRPIEEAVFLPGRLFRILAVRTAEEADDGDGPTAPRTAVLLREIVPGEPDAAAQDRVALAKLDRIWELRGKTAVRLVEDPDLVARLTMPMAVAPQAGS
jgi:hypothetical protein